MKHGKVKIGSVQRWIPLRGGEGERERICLMYLINLYENRTLKHVEIVLGKGVGHEGE
jgi:hypothetical protein